MDELSRHKFFYITILFFLFNIGFIVYTAIRLFLWNEIQLYPETGLYLYCSVTPIPSFILLSIHFKMGRVPGLTPPTEVDKESIVMLLSLTIGTVAIYGLGVVLGLLGARQLEWWLDGITWLSYIVGVMPLTLIYRKILERRKRSEAKARPQQEMERMGAPMDDGVRHAIDLYYNGFCMIKFLDHLCEHPFNYTYRKIIITEKFLNTLYELVAFHPKVQEIWTNNKIEDGIIQIITLAESIAKEKGVNTSKQHQFIKVTLMILIPYSIFTILLLLFVYRFTEFGFYWAMLFLIIGFIILQQILSHHLTTRWDRLEEEVGGKLRSLIVEEVQRLRNFVQFLIDYLGIVLSENNIDVTRYRFILYYPSYKHIKIRKKRKKYFIVELLPTIAEPG